MLQETTMRNSTPIKVLNYDMLQNYSCKSEACVPSNETMSHHWTPQLAELLWRAAHGHHRPLSKKNNSVHYLHSIANIFKFTTKTISQKNHQITPVISDPTLPSNRLGLAEVFRSALPFLLPGRPTLHTPIQKALISDPWNNQHYEASTRNISTLNYVKQPLEVKHTFHSKQPICTTNKQNHN